MTNQRQILLQSIATILVDYRQGEITAIDPNHINRWVTQFSKFGFDDEAQIIILGEMERILKSYYISRNFAQSFLASILTSQKLFGTNPAATIRNAQFLQIQRKGNSQNDLLNLCKPILQSNYGLNLTDFGDPPNIYIYLDDCLYSGNTVWRDVNEWIPNAVRGTTLHLIFFAVHTEGLRYSQKQVQLEAKKYGVAVKFWRLHTFKNSRWKPAQFDCFWTLQTSGEKFIDRYVQEISKRRQNSNRTLPDLFRPANMPIQDRIFSSPTARNLIEYAFLKVGAYIVSLPRSPNVSMKPLGYDYFDSLGFGAIFATYRNIANNCPLALWWGDPNKAYPLNAWYPLFPRTVNMTTASEWERF
ncbi:phosphoribosyltransferase-like protein [Lusitaniella coriacea]|uniref:phosphoribosyltransferase-like protein n=1 Tax=Lusitaniella coriacea TaxID=1983105 RepID=UPI003CF56452